MELNNILNTTYILFDLYSSRNLIIYDKKASIVSVKKIIYYIH